LHPKIKYRRLIFLGAGPKKFNMKIQVEKNITFLGSISSKIDISAIATFMSPSLPKTAAYDAVGFENRSTKLKF
jgi:hypothetical protein